MARRKKWEAGNVVEIALTDGTFSYAVVVPPSLLAFSRLNFTKQQEVSTQLFAEVSFTIGVMDYAIGDRHWPLVGHIELTNELKKKHTFYAFDLIGKKFRHVDGSFCTLREATLAQCIDLECAAVWDPEHVESRLLDEKNGRSNIWVESMRAESQANK
ncbi:MAG: immunity 26/phosphotriesterase HocA family protein [Acidiferrobacterales bacterium]|nr:immunity 26/phosphotriesterase HocA family protein [Acidiferrobacterales bacterium]